MVVFEQLYQIGRDAGFEPVVVELFVLKGVEQAERVVDAFRVFYKVVAVVTRLQFLVCLLVCYFLCGCQFVDFFFEVVVDFDLSEFRDSCKQGELDAAVYGF